MKTALKTARTVARIALFVALFMAPVAMFSAAHASNNGSGPKGAGIVILTGLQRA